jgi:hypothetical protein
LGDFKLLGIEGFLVFENTEKDAQELVHDGTDQQGVSPWIMDKENNQRP